VYFYYEKIFHRLESDSARNNIHPNNKQKPEIKKKHRKKNMSIWPARLCESRFQINVLIFTSFSGALVNATALTLLLESFARKSDSVAAF